MDVLLMLFLTFCGGAFGAMIGGLASFVLCGVTLLLGMMLAMAGGQFDFIGSVAFGVVFGPNISFVGGVAAAAFAKKMGYLESGKDISTGLLSLKNLNIITVGGLFGTLGYLVNLGISSFAGNALDTVALTVFIMALLTKFLFDADLNLKGLIGTVSKEIENVGGRFSHHSEEVWLPYMKTPAEKVFVAIVAGGLSAYVTQLLLQNPATESVAVLFGFGISATSLLFLQFGINIPVTHHITLVSAYAVAASGGNIYWGIVGAIIAAFLSDVLAKVFHVYGDSHVDPPAMGIMIGSFLFITVFPLTGVSGETNLIPILIIVIAITYSVAQSLRNKVKYLMKVPEKHKSLN
ncbi:hypothetical protein [Ureibacillus acetophenoni]|uniref:DUF7973 domain-containing protein n=1 Tax=Ureibacillus acetophenoni TaxID=614649 RepID=A0A285UA43_9BACL|nr:hypothetical protein [Ureibacillus acetophenoni]SOC38567.1 hypothetical protein SAMN05877842_104177 [Ureibacillus acetophenoni]